MPSACLVVTFRPQNNISESAAAVSVDDTSHDWQLMDGTHCVVTIAAELAHSAIAHNSHHKRSVMMIIMKSKLLIL